MKRYLPLLVVAVLALPVWAQRPRPLARPQPPVPPGPRLDARAVLRAMEEAFTTVADRVTPVVVNVSTVPRWSPAGPPDDPEKEKFREFFGDEFYEAAPASSWIRKDTS